MLGEGLKSDLGLTCTCLSIIYFRIPMFFKKKSGKDTRKLWEAYLKALLKQEFKKAHASLESLKEAEPRNPQVYMKLGDLLQRIGNSPEAVMSYHRAASILTNAGFGHKALAIYKIIIRIDPNDGEAPKKTAEVIADLESSKSPIPGAIIASEEIAEETALTENQPATLEAAAFLTEDTSVTAPAAWQSEEAAPPQWPSKEEVPVEEESSSEARSSAWPEADDWPSMPTEPVEPVESIELPAEDGLPAVIPQVFSSLSPEAVRSLFRKAVLRAYRDGESVVEEGDAGDSMFVIKSGKARVVSHIMGKPYELATLSEGDLFGEVAFLTGRPRTASVFSVTELKVYDLSRMALQEIIDTNREVRDSLVNFYYLRVQDTVRMVKKK